MKKNNCGIVRDLLPLYIDGVTGEESTQFIEEHLKVCSNCRALHDSMKDDSVETVVSRDTEEVIERHRKKERSSAFKLGLILASVFLVPFLIGLLHMAASGTHTGITDILVVSSGIFLAATIILVPIMSTEKKCVKTLLLGTVGILLVEMCVMIAEGKGTAFVPVWIYTVFGLSIPFFPVVIYKVPLGSYWKQNKGLLILIWDTIWFYITLIVFNISNLQGLKESLYIGSYFLIFVWGTFIVCRYYKGSGLKKVAGISILVGLFFGFGNDVMGWIYEGRHPLYLGKADLSLLFKTGTMPSIEIQNASISLAVMLVCFIVAVVFIVIDKIRRH